MIARFAWSNIAANSAAIANPTRMATRTDGKKRHSRSIIRTTSAGPENLAINDVERIRRSCRMVSAASACTSTPETTRPFGTLNRSPNSMAVPPTSTFLSFSRAIVAGWPARASLLEIIGTESGSILKSIHNGFLPNSVAACQHATHRGQELPLDHFPKGIAAHYAVRISRHVHDRWPRALGKVRQWSIQKDAFMVF